MSITDIINKAKDRVENYKADAENSRDTEYHDTLMKLANLLNHYISCAKREDPNCIKKLCDIMGVEVPKSEVGILKRHINKSLSDKNNKEIVDNNSDKGTNDNNGVGGPKV